MSRPRGQIREHWARGFGSRTRFDAREFSKAPGDQGSGVFGERVEGVQGSRTGSGPLLHGAPLTLHAPGECRAPGVAVNWGGGGARGVWDLEVLKRDPNSIRSEASRQRS